jgi:hypothetical protein
MPKKDKCTKCGDPLTYFREVLTSLMGNGYRRYKFCAKCATLVEQLEQAKHVQKEKPMPKYLIVVDEQAPASLDLVLALREQCHSSLRLTEGEFSVVGEQATIEKITSLYPAAVLKCEVVA